VSQEDFEKPEEITIRVDCDKPVEEAEESQELEDDLEGLDF
jgi:penicillin-binding protein 1A